MKFALFILASWTEPDASAQSRIYGEAVEQIQYAEELGFDSVWIAEHHSSRYGIFPSLMPILTYVAAKTKKIRIGAGVSVLPFHNPIFLAEESAMMDVLSGGRLEFGVGRGSTAYEYGNFQIDFDSRDARSQEALDIILGLWTTPRFSYHGKFYQVDEVTLAPSPVQKPHPPVFLAVSRTPASVDVAVSRDLPILTSFSTPEADNLGLFSLYAERCAAAGKPPNIERMPYFRFVYLSEDEKEGREYPRESLTWIRDLGGFRRTLTHGEEINVDLEHWRRTRPVDPPSYESELETTAY
ncbi:MAG: LLM class flavin-dependent oxidoreductase, partial [Chloroflexi bacterium]|nr:LLM class flavin-dependent oxidoreductase [Chloroflexota bacterium]